MARVTGLGHPGVVVISIDGFAAFSWSDPRARLPTLRRLAERGALAAGMETVFPTTTWPTHVSMVTGVSPAAHGVVANHVLNRETRATEDLTGDPVYDAPALLRAPTVYDRAHGAGLRTAAIDWPATRNATTLDFNLPFFKDQRVFETHTARAVWEELRALGYPMHRQGEWAELPKRFHKDELVGSVAAHVAASSPPSRTAASTGPPSSWCPTTASCPRRARSAPTSGCGSSARCGPTPRAAWPARRAS